MIKIFRTFLFTVAFTTAFSQGKEVPTIVDNRFATNPFSIELTPANISRIVSSKISIVKQTRKSKYDVKILDTLLTYKSKDGDFLFIKTKDKFLFDKATIIGSTIKLARGVEIGMSKDSFLKVFKGNEKLKKVNAIVITDSTSGYCYHAFYFENDKLVKISLNISVD